MKLLGFLRCIKNYWNNDKQDDEDSTWAVF